MDGDVTRLLKMHELAAQFGDGLKPELYELLRGYRKDWPDNVTPIEAPLRSSGPAHHGLSSEALAARGVTRLNQAIDKPARKHEADG